MAERLTAQQVKEYKGVFEMFDEEGNGEVKTGELERLMSLLGINPTKSELASMAKDVDRDNKGFFNCSSFLALMGVYWEKAQNQEGELRAAFRVFDKEGKGYIDWNTLKYVLMNAGEPLNEVEAEQMMKEADKDGDGTIDYEGVRGHDDRRVLQAGAVGEPLLPGEAARARTGCCAHCRPPCCPPHRTRPARPTSPQQHGQ